MTDEKTGKQIEVEIGLPEDRVPKPANHFVVSYTDDDFALDVIYINPFDLSRAAKNSEAKVRGEMVARVAMGYQNAVKLRDRLDEMIKSYEERKND